MSVHGDLVGALDVYSRRPNAFDAEAVSVAEIIAVHAAVASEVSAAFFHHRDLAANLRDAIHSRAVIEQAKGMLMAARRCGEDEAFAMLVKISQTEGRKVREVAAGIVANPPHFRQTET